MGIMKEIDGQLRQMEEDLLELCEDNDEMKEAIKGYFERCREEHEFGTNMSKGDMIRQFAEEKQSRVALLRNYQASLELGVYDDWANGLHEFMLKSDGELSPEIIKKIVMNFLEERSEDLKR
jgi:hypothetical protein